MSPAGEAYQSFDGEYGGLWRRNGRPPNRLVGIGFAAQGFERSGYYERQAGADDPRAAFAFVGVAHGPIGDFGSIGSGAAGEEIDRWDTRDGTPIHALVLARADKFGGDMLRTKEDFLSTMPPFDDPNVRADMVFFECPHGGAVFSTGANTVVLLDRGMSYQDIGSVLLIDHDTIRTWRRLFEHSGISALAEFGHEGCALGAIED